VEYVVLVLHELAELLVVPDIQLDEADALPRLLEVLQASVPEVVDHGHVRT